MHVVHASFDPDALRASCDNYDPTSYLSILVHHRIILKFHQKSVKKKAKFGQNRKICVLYSQKVQQLEKSTTPPVMAVLTNISYDYDKHLCH